MVRYLLAIFLAAGFISVSQAQQLCEKRYYFSSYQEMVQFFKKPSSDKVSYSSQTTPFYADVYRSKTIHEAVTTCIHHDTTQKKLFYTIEKSSLPSPGKDNDPSYSIKMGEADYAQWQPSPQTSEPSEKKSPSLSWKIITPTGENLTSKKYFLNPPEFFNVCKAISNTRFNASLSKRSDGKNSLHFSFGDKNRCDDLRSGWKRMDERCKDNARQRHYLATTPPDKLLEHSKALHHSWVTWYLKKSKGKNPILEQRATELLSLQPPVYKLHDFQEKMCNTVPQYKLDEYYKSLSNLYNLYHEIEKLTNTFAGYYWKLKSLFGVNKKDLQKLAQHYQKEVDRITQNFYKEYPQQAPPGFTSITLSHPVTHQLCLTHPETLTALKHRWTEEQKNARARNDNSRFTRYQNRHKALEDSLMQGSEPYDYSSSIAPHALFTDPDANLFDNCYGSALDHQLHQELCCIRTQMHNLQIQLPNNRYVQTYVPLINATTAQAKAESSPDKGYNLADFSRELVTLASHGISFISSQAIQTAHSLANTDLKTCAIMAGKAACAVTKGIIQGVATTFNPHHWYDMAVGTVGMLQFLGYILKEQAWLDEHDAQRWRALLSGNEKLYEELINRFEKHGTADIQKINAQFDQSCAQLAALSWDQLLENGAAFGTTLVLDAVACHAVSYATTQAGRAFIQTVSELLFVPQALGNVKSLSSPPAYALNTLHPGA